MNRHMNRQQLPAKQRGAVLMIGMVFMLLLTIIGISSMSSTILELKIATNLQQQSLAFSQAERTLVAAQQDVAALVTNPAPFDFVTPSNDAYYTTGVGGNNINLSNMDWPGITTKGTPTDKYVVEFLGIKDMLGESIKVGDPVAGKAAYTFRLSAHSDAGKGAVRVVQSIYVTDKAP